MEQVDFGDVRSYLDRYDFTERRDIGFNKAWVYNNSQNTGLLNLVPEKKNNMRQQLDYPKFKSDSLDILTTQSEGKWSFNYLYNLVQDEYSNLPQWLNDCNQILKSVNPKGFIHKNKMKDRLRGDWFTLRLQNDAESRYHYIFKWMQDNRNFQRN